MNSLKKGEGVPLLNFVGGPGIQLLNFEGRPGIPLLNFRGGGSRVPLLNFEGGPGVLVPLLHHVCQWVLPGVFIANFEHILHLFVVFLLSK